MGPQKSINSLNTPALLVEQSILDANLDRMQKLANKNNVVLRPHVKTHKSPLLAKKQLEYGASGVAVATLNEAEAMVEGGITDIHLANEINTEPQIRKLLALQKRANITCTVDQSFQVQAIDALASDHGRVVEVFIEVDTGLNRAGVSSEGEAIELGKIIQAKPFVKLKGLMTHAGNAYGAGNYQEIVEIGQKEGRLLVQTAEAIRSVGLEVEVVSAGSTPTAPIVAPVAGVTELRVGNYLVNDLIQEGLGVAGINECALNVLASVISIPTADRVVVDAGSKALTSDQGAHGNSFVQGFGQAIAKDCNITRLSEEHGVIENVDSSRFRFGEMLRIVPNHACPVFNLFSHANLVNDETILSQFSIVGKH